VTADALAAALPDDVAAVHTGTLALIMEPIGSAIEELITKELSPETVVMLDPNCRPSAIRDREAYLSRLTRIMRRADIVKVSTEDIEYLYPGERAEVAAGRLLGEGPTLVLVTDGPHPVRAFLPGRELSAEVPRVPIVDAIGAGDTFGGTFLALWLGDGRTRSDLGPDAEIGATLRLSIEAVGAFLSRAAG
jgi:fructokinase